MAEDPKTFTRDELAAGDGADGRPALVAANGSVYDVAASKMWRRGGHMNRHRCGQELTDALKGAPHGPEVLERVQRVGVLAEQPRPAPRAAPAGALERLLHAVPFLRRHPHPLMVHFPIAFCLAAPATAVLYRLTGLPSLETDSFHCLVVAVGGLLLGIGSGVATWWLNYEARFVRPVVAKLVLSPLLFAAAVAALAWRVRQPAVLDDPALGTWYLGLVCLLAPLVSAIGWFGAALTFPVEKE